MHVANYPDALHPVSGSLFSRKNSGLSGLDAWDGSGSWSSADNLIANAGFLEPGERISRESAVYIISSGQSALNPERYANFQPSAEDLEWAEAFLLRASARIKAERAYSVEVAARIAAAPAAVAMLEYDSTGRATDSSIAKAAAYQNSVTSAQAAEVEKTREEYKNVINFVATEYAPAVVNVTSDATVLRSDVAPLVQSELNKGTPYSTIQSEIVRRYGISARRAEELFTSVLGDYLNEVARTAPIVNAAAAAAAAAATTPAGSAASTATGGRAAIVFPADFTSRTGVQKVEYYRTLIRGGYTDAEIRAAAESRFGRQTDADWNWLRQAAAATPAVTAPGEGGAGVPPVRVVRPTDTGTGTGTGTGAGTGGGAGLLIAAAAAYFLLG